MWYYQGMTMPDDPRYLARPTDPVANSRAKLPQPGKDPEIFPTGAIIGVHAPGGGVMHGAIVDFKGKSVVMDFYPGTTRACMLTIPLYATPKWTYEGVASGPSKVKPYMWHLSARDLARMRVTLHAYKKGEYRI